MVTSFGEYADPNTLKGHVKLNEGVGIKLTRRDDLNAIRIAVELPPGAQTILTAQTGQNRQELSRHLTSSITAWSHA